MVRSSRRQRAPRRARVIACCVVILLSTSLAELAPAIADATYIIGAVFVLTIAVDVFGGVLRGLFRRIPHAKAGHRSRKVQP